MIQTGADPYAAGQHAPGTTDHNLARTFSSLWLDGREKSHRPGALTRRIISHCNAAKNYEQAVQLGAVRFGWSNNSFMLWKIIEKAFA
jgi:hypothetical protein